MLNFLTNHTNLNTRGKYLQKQIHYSNYIITSKVANTTNINFDFWVSNLIKIELTLFFAKQFKLKFTNLQIQDLLKMRKFQFPYQKNKKTLYSCLYPVNTSLSEPNLNNLKGKKSKKCEDITIIATNYITYKKISINLLNIINDLSLTIEKIQMLLKEKTEIPLFLIEKPLQLQKLYFLWKNQYISQRHILPGGIHNTTDSKETIYHFLPKAYTNYFKHMLTYKGTLMGLYKFIGSKRRSKKYLRIIHKRLRLYTCKKVPWRAKLKYF